MQITTSLQAIAAYCQEHSEENDAFKAFLKTLDSLALDEAVFELNKRVEPLVDCTTCGNCCRTLMINVEEAAIIRLSDLLGITVSAFKSQFIETGNSRQFFNAIPCHFLKDCKCTVYSDRPSACHDFPSLHQPGFNGRLFATFMHYDRCPIIFNVLEGLKKSTGFFGSPP